MGLREKWRRYRDDHKNYYSEEEQRLNKMLADLDPLDDDYVKLQQIQKNNLAMRDTSKESKRKICKSDRGGLLMTLLKVGGGIGCGIMISKFEHDGMTYTGEKRSFMDSLTKMFGNLFFSRN